MPRKTYLMPFLILFFLISMAEVYVFMTVGNVVGVLATLLLCFMTAMIGGFIVRLQGLDMLMRAQNNFRAGKIPLNEIFSGFCIVIAGALLITPGFVTDFVGFLLLIPIFRVFLQKFLSQNTRYTVNTGESGEYRQNNPNSDVIEGDYEHVEKTDSSLDHTPKDN